MNSDNLISYAHKNDQNGVRFSQYAHNSIPDWAVNIKWVTEGNLKMNIYLLSQNTVRGYDTYDSCVVFAKDEESARKYILDMVLNLLKNTGLLVSGVNQMM